MAMKPREFFPRVFKRRENALPRFSETNDVWDSMLVNYRGTWYVKSSQIIGFFEQIRLFFG